MGLHICAATMIVLGALLVENGLLIMLVLRLAR